MYAPIRDSGSDYRRDFGRGTDNSPAASPLEIFENVQKIFLDSLSARERQHFRTFPDARSMLESIQKTVDHSATRRSRLTICLTRVRAFAQRIEPFFEVLGIFASSHPEFAAVVWGSIRLVFQACCMRKGFVAWLTFCSWVQTM